MTAPYYETHAPGAGRREPRAHLHSDAASLSLDGSWRFRYSPTVPAADFVAPDFDDARWPRAFEFTNQDVGVDHIPAYTRFPEAFAGARWIWSYNLVFDNLVLVRKTVR